jgi:hypothetical protein
MSLCLSREGEKKSHVDIKMLADAYCREQIAYTIGRFCIQEKLRFCFVTFRVDNPSAGLALSFI